jgi:hypothetical protein
MWPSFIAILYLREAVTAEAESVRQRNASRASYWLNMWDQLARRRETGDEASPRNRIRRAHRLAFMAQAALASGEMEEAATLAREVLRIIPSAEEAGGAEDSGGAESFNAHIVLGRVALAHGDLPMAEQSLLDAASISPPVAAFATFGPDTALAQGLLVRGRTEAVIRYLEACQGFWVLGQKQVHDWIERIRQGEIPDLSTPTYDRKALLPLLSSSWSRMN